MVSHRLRRIVGQKSEIDVLRAQATDVSAPEEAWRAQETLKRDWTYWPASASKEHHEWVAVRVVLLQQGMASLVEALESFVSVVSDMTGSLAAMAAPVAPPRRGD